MDERDLRGRLKAAGIKQVEAAKRLGISEGKLSTSLSGGRRFTVAEMDTLREMLREREGDEGGIPLDSLPVIGQVAAGNWRHAVQQPIGSFPRLDPSMPPKAFALRVKGDSMDLEVDDGGTVVVDPDDRALFPGRFYVVLNDEGETTFKKFAAEPARLVPCSSNDQHKEIILGSGERFEVVGRVIWKAARM